MRIVCEVPQQVLQAAPLQGSAQWHQLCRRTVTVEKTLPSRITEHAAGALAPRSIPGAVQVCAASSADKPDRDGDKLAARHPSSQPAEWSLARFCLSCCSAGHGWVGKKCWLMFPSSLTAPALLRFGLCLCQGLSEAGSLENA